MIKAIEKIRASIDSIVALSDAEFDIFCGYLESHTLLKDAYFLREGEICNAIGFIDRGVLIYCKLKENGDEVTTDFAFEGDWVTNNLSRLTVSPSLLNVKAIEDTSLLLLKQSSLTKLYVAVPKIERLGRILMEQAYLRIVRQSIDLQVLSAKERYLSLISGYPEILQRVSLYHIANYLGIAPKSLSRIRKEIIRK